MNEFIKITGRPAGKRFAISDIHGCFKTFRMLVEQVIKLTKSDQLFLLGDYIDRGPSGKEVLDYIMELITLGYNIFPLRGNHENDLLDYAKEDPRFLLWHAKKNGYPDIIREEKLLDKYYQFIDGLPYYYELEDYYLVHAGFDFKSENPFGNKTAMLWLRYFDPPENQLSGKKVIHGHEPVYMQIILDHIQNDRASIPLDNGVPYVGKHKIYDTSQMGNLCALNLDTLDLFKQKNIDMEPLPGGKLKPKNNKFS